MTHTFRRLKHTIRLGYDLGEFEAIEIVDEEGRSAIQIPTDTIPYAEELAAYIIQACNAYPLLLEACKANQEMRQHILTCPRCADGALCDTFNDLDQRADRLTRAAITAAEPKEV